MSRKKERERERERGEKNAIYSGHLRLCQQPRAAHALRSDQLVERQLNNIRKHNNASRDKRRTAKLEEELKDLNAKDMMLSDIYTVVCKPENSFWMPNVKKLVLLALLSPVGNAVVERLFSLMNITKTLLRNCLGDKNLDILLRLNKEAPEAWTNEEKDDLVELWIARKRNKEQKFRWKL